MFPNRMIFLLIFFFTTAFTQKENVAVREEVYALITEADYLLEKSKISESLEVSKKALTLAYRNNHDDYVAMAYNIIAGCHESLSDSDKALQYYNKALYFAESSQNEQILDWINNNIGNIYNFDKKEYRKSIKYYQKSLAISEKYRDTTSIIYTKLNLAWAYFNLKKTNLGFENLQFIEQNIDKHGDDIAKVNYYTLKGIYYSQINNPGKANENFDIAISLGKKLPDLAPLAEAYEAYSSHLYETKNFQKAYLLNDQFIQLKQNLFDKELRHNAQHSSMKIELDETKREILKIEAENLLKDKNMAHARIIIILGLLIIIILSILIHNFYNNHLYRENVNLELIEQNAKLTLAKTAAEQASKIKSQLISKVSHELRTPLYGMVGIADMLLEDYPQLAENSSINSLKFSGRYLLFLINDLLQISQIEEHKENISYQAFNLYEQIERCQTTLHFYVLSSNNKIEIDCDPEIPEIMMADKCKLSQILINILHNSLKFTQNGNILIKARILKVDGKNIWIEFTIKDSGCGIEEENLQTVFDEFIQIDRRDGGYKGIGLGLTLVKRLVTMMGGTVSIDSNKNVGTTIKFSFPFLNDAQMVNDYINSIEVNLGISPKTYKILVVEDNKINQLVTRKNVEKNGHLCHVVDDGYAAIDKLKHENFDLILMDINMPMLNGFDTTKLIREIDQKIPIVALTAYNREEVYHQAIHVGMNDVIIKPFDPKQFFDTIHNYIAIAS
ncbi:response regulator [Flavobacterium sp. NST-5]|uniref:histidine kinase n=1 Tax=Flavobacterium ichthyis TaxID=2698827 RepID=A0ABW9ZAW0_9FLAO|nr:response regulator [Flavobacterium ichthyis]NBL65829.1 response regulator [Flavobacterium ichthyis]